jgi:peptidoglycan hydrolase-like protein with peptidoglycan-binding domain
MKKTFIYIAIFALLVPGVSFAAFDTNLSYGARSPKVLELQEFLTDQGVYSGPITGNFFTLTLSAVKAFQTKNSISPVSGFFGPLTRAKANSLLEEQLTASGAAELEETGGVQEPQSNDENTNLVNEVRRLNDKLSQIEQNTKKESSPTVQSVIEIFDYNVDVNVEQSGVSFKIDKKFDKANLVAVAPGITRTETINPDTKKIEIGFEPSTTFQWEITAKKGDQEIKKSGVATTPNEYVKLIPNEKSIGYDREVYIKGGQKNIASIMVKFRASTSRPMGVEMMDGRNLYVENGNIIEATAWDGKYNNITWKLNGDTGNIGENDLKLEIIDGVAKTKDGREIKVTF